MQKVPQLQTNRMPTSSYGAQDQRHRDLTPGKRRSLGAPDRRGQNTNNRGTRVWPNPGKSVVSDTLTSLGLAKFSLVSFPTNVAKKTVKRIERTKTKKNKVIHWGPSRFQDQRRQNESLWDFNPLSTDNIHVSQYNELCLDSGIRIRYISQSNDFLTTEPWNILSCL